MPDLDVLDFVSSCEKHLLAKGWKKHDNPLGSSKAIWNAC